MAVVYTKQDQGKTITIGTGVPSHPGVNGDEYTNLTTGDKYLYSTSWVIISTGGGGGVTSVAFSPINIGICDTAPTAASTQYYYQTVAEATMTISKAKLWGYSGSDTVLFGIYRGTFASLTLIGQGSITAGIGPNEITLTPEVGQTLDVTAGEDIVVGFYTNGTSWRTIYDTGISDVSFALINTANITTMPATPSGTGTAVRFALTLY
jgi:hypothetical protein